MTMKPGLKTSSSTHKTDFKLHVRKACRKVVFSCENKSWLSVVCCYLHLHLVPDIQTLHCLFVVFPCQCLYIAHFYKLYMFTKASLSCLVLHEGVTSEFFSCTNLSKFNFCETEIILKKTLNYIITGLFCTITK